MLLAATTHQPLTPDASWLVYPLSTDHYPLLLHSASLGRTAAVVRNRRNVPNGTHVQTGGGECAHRRFASRSGAADPQTAFPCANHGSPANPNSSTTPCFPWYRRW